MPRPLPPRGNTWQTFWIQNVDGSRLPQTCTTTLWSLRGRRLSHPFRLSLLISIQTFSSHFKSLFKPSSTHQVGPVDWRGVDIRFGMSPFQIRIRCFKWHWIQMLSIVNCIPWIVAEENKFNAQTQIIILNAKGTGLHSVQRHLFQIVGCINYGCWTRWTDAQTFPARDHP